MQKTCSNNHTQSDRNCRYEKHGQTKLGYIDSGAFSPMKCTTLNDTNIGTVTMDNKLVTAVNEIESGAFPPQALTYCLLPHRTHGNNH